MSSRRLRLEPLLNDHANPGSVSILNSSSSSPLIPMNPATQFLTRLVHVLLSVHIADISGNVSVIGACVAEARLFHEGVRWNVFVLIQCTVWSPWWLTVGNLVSFFCRVLS